MRQRQWLKLVKDYDFEIRYYQEKANVVVDTLSRKAFLSHITIQKELQQEILREQIEVVTCALI